MYLDSYEQVCCKLGVIMDATELHFDTNPRELDLDAMSHGFENAKTSAPFISYSSNLIWIELGLMLILACLNVTNGILISSRLISI